MTYQIAYTSQIITPALIVFRDIVESNLDEMVRIAGDPRRLRPHCKTHKMPDVVRLELERGIVRHKAATFAEAEMLADNGVRDIFLAYNIVGANLARTIAFRRKYPDVQFSVTADHPGPIAQLGQAASNAGVTVDVLLDLDTGQHRTGVEAGPQAMDLYRMIARTQGLRPGGLHLYDGHNHQSDVSARRTAVMAGWEQASRLRDEIERSDLPVPRIVCGGTGSFPIFASFTDPVIELSPGTCVFADWGYGQLFPDLQFVPAALLLTRVISRPTPHRVTLDLGYKAVASDPPAGNRLMFPDLPDAVAVLQNEEHLVIETSQAADFSPGDEILAIPRHVCPTVALHKEVYVVSRGEVVGRWPVTARDRQLII